MSAATFTVHGRATDGPAYRETLLAAGSIRMKGSTNTVTAAKMLDPVCDMIVDLAEARDQGLTLELPDREYAFCGQGCQTKFAKSPETYRAKVDAWLVAESRDEHLEAHAHADEVPAIDAGMREWYKACCCCMHDAYPAVVAEAQQPGSP